MIMRSHELKDVKYSQLYPYKVISKNGKLSSHDLANNTWNRLGAMGNIAYGNEAYLGPFEGIKDCWKGQPAFVVGASACLKGFDLTKLNGLHTIGCNHMIEYYDGFEWFIFLDDKFLQITTYDLNNFKGKIFAGNKTRILPGINAVRFKTRGKETPFDFQIENGLFNMFQTGLCATHLALIAGADPIYLLGIGNDSQNTLENNHYDENYNGEIKTENYFKKYVGAHRYFNYFKDYADRITLVSNESDIKTFPIISINEFEKKLETIKENNPVITNKVEIKQDPIICHVHKLRNQDSWNEVSRQIYSLTEGRHIQSSVDDLVQPKADIYLLECLINGSKEYINFQKPKGSKVISLIHSSGKCLPAVCSDKVVTLTNFDNQRIKNRFNSVVIPCSIDVDQFKDPDYSKLTYGRITRFSPGKVHPGFINVVNQIKEQLPDSQCILITKTNIKNNNIQYVENVESNDTESKINALNNLTIFADMHNTFVETFSLCLLEGMAAGLCMVLYSPINQGAMIEVLGGSGIICDSPEEFKQTIIKLLPDKEAKKEYGQKAKNRARFYSIDKMIKSYNELFKAVLNENS